MVTIKKVKVNEVISAVQSLISSSVETLEEIRISRIDPVTFEMVVVDSVAPVISQAVLLRHKQAVKDRVNQANNT